MLFLFDFNIVGITPGSRKKGELISALTPLIGENVTIVTSTKNDTKSLKREREDDSEEEEEHIKKKRRLDFDEEKRMSLLDAKRNMVLQEAFDTNRSKCFLIQDTVQSANRAWGYLQGKVSPLTLLVSNHQWEEAFDLAFSILEAYKLSDFWLSDTEVWKQPAFISTQLGLYSLAWKSILQQSDEDLKINESIRELVTDSLKSLQMTVREIKEDHYKTSRIPKLTDDFDFFWE
eukprot:TRINITY_DN3061_c0_g1_i2.p1 TRINITY_DN3061_c0_g1~~TRINITY_DN3061_c0_g1_i2.p1  ORF type:complete len:233 (+),score=47.75 TRINITY_DN3061_c0_g1_i2:594-1292(+)